MTTTEAEARIKGDSHLHESDGAPSPVPRSGGQEAVWVGRLSPAPVVIEGVLAEESDAALAPVMESIRKGRVVGFVFGEPRY